MKRGYILHHRPYRETSVLLNLLVDGVGRVDAVARLGSGKRSIKSIIQPFQPLLFEISGKSELKNAYQIEPASPAVPIQGNPLYAAMYLNELCVRCLSSYHGAENLFVSYHQTLMALASSFQQADLRYFEKALLLELGAMPALNIDVYGDDICAENLYCLQLEQGFQPVTMARENQKYTQEASQIFQGEMLLQLQRQQLNLKYERQAKYLMRSLFSPLLGGKPLASRQLFQQSSS
ncbi:DNA repair protein RecO [Shewanella gelidii]|uniref:DNA repair protein RecO n=1 Tax=Shewanella gelidii TaxID=1642821 RepID=A0A917JHU2_9GAMM|nr:DNA repair protein RecO [Shewanella gelidii]MCL1096666.1 DNA repair protein RecO [Shewanella gelidii]GGI69360.1 DNA repair protein RecO [Shewanella gelidii]